MHVPETPTKKIYWEIFLKEEGTQEQGKGKMKSFKFTSRISTEHLQIRGTYICKCTGKLEISEAQPSCWRGALYTLDGPIVQTKHCPLSHLYTFMSLLSFLCLGHHLPGTPLSPFTFDNFHELMRLLLAPPQFCLFSNRYWQWNPSKGQASKWC